MQAAVVVILHTEQDAKYRIHQELVGDAASSLVLYI